MSVRVFVIAIVIGVLPAPAAQAQAPDGPPPTLSEQVLTAAQSPRGSFLSLRDAVVLGLERNPTLLVERARVEEARQRVGEERGPFDPVLSVSASGGRRENIVASRFYPTGLYVDREGGSRVAIDSKTPFGSHVNAAFDYRYLDSTSNTQTLSPQYSVNLVLGFTQPLLRDFGRDATTARIKVAAKLTEMAEQTLAQRVAELVQHVEEEYWTLAFARQQLESRQRGLEVERSFLTRAELLMRADRVAATQVLQARLGVAQRESDIAGSETDVARAEDRLKLLLAVNLSGRLSPVERLDGLASIPEVDKSVEAALAHRPEILAIRREVEQREIEVQLAKNQKLPRLDVAGQYSVPGMAGKPNPTCIDPTSPLCIPVGTGVEDSVFANRTSPGDAFGMLFSRNRFDGWSAELHLEVPIGNHTANAQFAEANLRLNTARTKLRAAHDQVEQEIRNTIRDALAARKRATVAEQTAQYIAAQLDDARRQFEARLTSDYDVQRANDELDKARTLELKALMDYNIALSRVRLADMSILDQYNIDLPTMARDASGQR